MRARGRPGESVLTEKRKIEISIPARQYRRRSGIRLHRRTRLDATHHDGLPVTTVVRTLADLAGRLPPYELEFAINEADKRGLADPETLRQALGDLAGQRGVAALRRCLDQRAFTLTDSELERMFLPLIRRAGLPAPGNGTICERLRGRLLLAGFGARRRDRRLAVSPNTCPAG